MIKSFIYFFIFLPSLCFADDFCFLDTAKQYNLNANLLKAISIVESSSCNQSAVNFNNRNKTIDYGCMQINSWWFPILKKHGISPASVQNNKCVNIAIAGWILKNNIIISKGDIWLAVGAYNAGFRKSSEKARRDYVRKVYTAYTSL